MWVAPGSFGRGPVSFARRVDELDQLEHPAIVEDQIRPPDPRRFDAGDRELSALRLTPLALLDAQQTDVELDRRVQIRAGDRHVVDAHRAPARTLGAQALRDHVAREDIRQGLVAADHLCAAPVTNTVPGRGSALKFDAPASW